MNTNLLCVNGADVETTGSIVWWRLSDTISQGKLAEVVDKCSGIFGITPQPVPQSTAARRAVEACQEKHLFARTLEGTNKWALILENTKGREWAMLAEVWIDKLGMHLDMADVPGSEALRVKLCNLYDRQLKTYQTSDMSTWLSSILMPETSAVPLRDTGGIYFVPRQSLIEYKEICEAIASISNHKFFEIPVLKCEEAVEAILDAINREALNVIDTIDSEVNLGGLGNKALKTRITICETLLYRVRGYEGLLGKKIGDITSKIEALQAGIVMLTLVHSDSQLSLDYSGSPL